MKERKAKLDKTNAKIKSALMEKLKIDEMSDMLKQSVINKFDTMKPGNIKIKRPAIMLPFMNEGEHVVNQQEND